MCTPKRPQYAPTNAPSGAPARRRPDGQKTTRRNRMGSRALEIQSHGPCQRQEIPSRPQYKCVLERHVLPALGSHRVRDLTPQDVQALADKARTPAVRTKIIASLRRLSNLAIHNLVWHRAREAVGLPNFRFHDLRHTGLTLYAQQGATLAEIMERGGHSDVEVAMRYQHAAADRMRRLADSLPVEL